MAKDPLVSVADIEKATMPQAPKAARDFWAAGANEEYTLRENEEAFNRYRLRQRVMRDVSQVDLRPTSRLLGNEYSFPLGLSPSAFHEMAHKDGELATARAAKSRNIPMCCASFANKPLEQVKQVGGDSAVFMQLYVLRNRETTKRLLKKMEKAGYKAVLMTVDTPVVGRRYNDLRNGFKMPAHLKLANFTQDVTQGSRVDIGSEADSDSRQAVDEQKSAGSKDNSSIEQTNVIDPTLTWDIVPWLKSVTNMQIWAKGITTGEDAELAVKAGVDGIMVSNHGGRQLDTSIATIDCIEEVAKAVNGRVPVHLDSGVRRGGDIFKALALGADFVWIGRPVIYGLLHDGQAGVEKVIDILESDFRYAMALTGTTSVKEISKDSLVRYGHKMEKL